MATNPFEINSQANNKVPRNTHDLSFQNNLSLQFGRVYPTCVIPVVSGESVRVKPTFGLRSLPMVFPVQTRMFARMHFYYVRNRAVWDSFQDWKFNTKANLVPPTIKNGMSVYQENVKFGTGELSDYLGFPSIADMDAPLPTCVTPTYGDYDDNFKDWKLDRTRVGRNTPYLDFYKLARIDINPKNPEEVLNASLMDRYMSSNYDTVADHLYMAFRIDCYPYSLEGADCLLTAKILLDKLYFDAYPQSEISFLGNAVLLYVDDNNKVLHTQVLANQCKANISDSYPDLEATNVDFMSADVRNIAINKYPDAKRVYVCITTPRNFLTPNSRPAKGDPYNIDGMGVKQCFSSVFLSPIRFKHGVDLKYIPRGSNPFANGQCPTNATIFRHYEAIRNAYYRNQLVDPYKINGEIEYNKWCHTSDSLDKDENFDFFNVNWESDLFTSCLPSPQQGAAPLVGVVTVDGTQSLAIRDEDGNVRTIKPNMSEDGKTLQSIDVQNAKQETTVVTASDAPKMGITINDFRNVNALQKYLELNQRKGYRYRDLVKGHYDVDIKYDTLNMPEFIGGVNKEVYVNPIMATAATTNGDTPTQLGDIAGVGGIVGDCPDITKYCDEDGFIIGLMYVLPTPTYSQTLAPYLKQMHHLDVFTPEFANIGYQPVSKDLLAPLQYYLDPTESAKPNVFGYNRPWGAYIRNFDESHGLFRTQLRNFLLNRQFRDMPELGRDFVTCDGTQLNDVFSSTLENEDKLIGDVWFKITKQSPIPLFAIPQL